jgi:ribonuclease-3
MITRDELENLLGTKINDITNYTVAFTHKSFDAKNSYDNLEFIGDSVLGFIVTKYLYDMFGSVENEGFLTKARTKIVRGSTLSNISDKLGLYKWIQMDEKGIKNNWNRNAKILEDVFEALIGAMYLDLGLINTRIFVLNLIKMYPVDLTDDDNFKDKLMRICHIQRKNLPVYALKQSFEGIFNIEVFIDGVKYGVGKGQTKKQAEQDAAKDALKVMVELTVDESNCREANKCEI